MVRSRLKRGKLAIPFEDYEKMQAMVEKPRASIAELAEIRGHVVFENVHFSYGTGPEVLHGMTLDVPPGTTVALVGHTGAGKSTMMKIITCYLPQSEGEVKVCGFNVAEDAIEADLQTSC